ncbi:class I SAM-dependent methyltransferase [Neotamlana laminarinivorans]|uniref:Class I SAM-dependent methyltransferase n=1 Tax=Neotamlana laminarinivorans TaxID=2883124 RepID=A0A9X1L120_9FLAO|nr:class I SAM-dependent methyltransferase [Tamlana laminarinivorans]MCB4798298.1 class I SAM-dependent methyltransferase [Tamlana laminarinivorans]
MLKQSKNIILKVKDYSVSGEDFTLLQNETYGFLETHPQPSKEKLPEYYKSEDYISHTDAKRNFFEKVYHLVRVYALNKKLSLINNYVSTDKNLLDVGCGTGDFLSVAIKNGWQVSGVEPNQQARDIANKKTNNAVFNVEKLKEFQEASFNVITLWHVLEHLPNIEEHIELFKKLLKPNGVLIIAVPNYKSYDAKHYKSFWAAYDVPRHLWHFNKSSIKNLMESYGFNLNQIKPMWFDAFYVSLLSEKYKTGKINFIKGFFIGLVSNVKALASKETSSLIYVVKK